MTRPVGKATVPYPARFRPLIEQAIEANGVHTYTEIMGRILEQHFQDHPAQLPIGPALRQDDGPPSQMEQMEQEEEIS